MSERDACAAIRGHVLRGAYAEAALFGDALSADLRARPGIALALARARILQGRFNEANTALEAADSAMAEPGERLILALEAAALRLYWDMAVTEALAAAGAALASADPEAGLADRAEAERIHARILLIAATYREIPAIVGQRARARLPEVAEVLERAGRPDEALAARMTWAERTGELVARRAALADVASRALDANRPAVAAQARLAQAEQMLNAGASSEALSAELDTASSLFAEARHVHGPIDVQRLRALIRVEREYAGLEELDACLAAYRRIDYPSGEMGLLVNLSQLALERGDTPAAADYRLRGLELADATGMGFARDNLLLAQIDLLMRTADYSSAIELGQAILATPVPAFQAASSEHLLATAYAFVQDYPPALTHGRGAIARFEAIGAEESASLTALQLANSLDSTRDEPTWKEAVTLLTEWIGRDTQRGDLAAAASKQELLAQIHLNRYYYSPTRHGDATLLAEVEQLLAAGEQLAATLSGREAARRHGALHQLRGQLLTARHAPEEAEQEWRAALAVYQAAGLEMEAAGCWDIIGVMRLNRANQELIPHFGEAETALAHALEYYSRAVMRDRSADTRFMLARLYVNASPRVAPDLGGRLLDEALRLLSEAEADYDLLRREFAGPVLSAQTAKRTLVRRSRRIYDLALEIQVWRRDADAAWSWCQRAKARALSDALGTSSSPPARVMAALEAHAGSLALVTKERELAVRCERAEPGERLALRSELAAVRQQMESDPHLEEYLELRTGATVDQADLALLLDPPAAAGERCVCIHWGQAGSRFVLLVIRPGGATEMRVLPSEVSVENVQAFVRANLGPAHFRLALRDAPDLLRVMDPLIAPLAELTQPDELLILAPAGPLYALPLHALELNGAPLLARNPVVYSPSLGVLRHCLARRKERPLPRKMVLFGDPSGDRAEAAELVQHLARRFLAETRSGAAVTRAAFTDLASGRDVVHFQGHARHDRRDALNSHLVLADGPFTARDVFGLRDLVAEIVTLGACESAANVLERGDEPLGLVPAFLVAGAGAVLATLWPVHRASAAWVMRRFYETLDDRGGGPEAIVSKARALRTVMLEAAEQPGWEVPYHWAPFVLTGDWA